MEYIKGPTLEKILEKERVLGTEQAIDFIKQISYGVDHAHKAKIIHRDLRPSNIIVSEDGTAKITDFGTSAWLNAVPYASTRIGSPPYMAPEQFMGKASFAADLYSLGCIFYEMIIGRPPIFDPDPFKILEKAQLGQITPPRIKNARIPREVDAIIMRALAPKVEDRYQSASEIIRDLSLYKGKTPKTSEIDDIMLRIRAREQKTTALCWNCRRPLPPKSRACPHCGETV